MFPGLGCNYSCSEQPEHLEVVNDISGTGVLIGFIGTAYLVVFVLIAYYLFAFNPRENVYQTSQEGPRREGRGTSADVDATEANLVSPMISGHAHYEDGDMWRPNPFDVMILDWLRNREWSCIWTRTLAFRKFPHERIVTEEDREEQKSRRRRLGKAFKKCVATLCDTQIVTGLGILVSGYASLPCGLTAHYWKVIIYLAWYSNLTHASAIVYLREELFEKPVERALRIVSMFILVLMLFVAIIPTAYFDFSSTGAWEREWASANSSLDDWNLTLSWNMSLPWKPILPYTTPATPAICFFNLTTAKSLWWNTNYNWLGPDWDEYYYVLTPMSSMVTSLILLIANFALKSSFLWKSLTRGFHSGFRKPLSRTAYWFLENSGLSPTVLQVLLAIVLLFRMYLDLLISTFSEIYWIVFTITWVTFHMKSTMGAIPTTSGEDYEWTFGQILPVFLLALPLLNLLQYFVPEDKQAKPEEIHSRRHSRKESVTVSDNRLWLAKRNFYKSPWMKYVLALACLQILYFTVFLFWLYDENSSVDTDSIGTPDNTGTHDASVLVVAASTFPAWFLFTQPLMSFLSIYIGLVSEGYFQGKKWPRRLFYGTITITLLGLSAAMPFMVNIWGAYTDNGTLGWHGIFYFHKAGTVDTNLATSLVCAALLVGLALIWFVLVVPLCSRFTSYRGWQLVNQNPPEEVMMTTRHSVLETMDTGYSHDIEI